MGHRFLCGQVLHVASPKLCVCDILFIIYVLLCNNVNSIASILHQMEGVSAAHWS
jgi:hypothetical protein